MTTRNRDPWGEASFRREERETSKFLAMSTYGFNVVTW